MANRQVLATLTGEFYQPVRLHYQVPDQSGLKQAFEKLRCLDYDRTQNRWVWLYDHEAERLPLKKSYADLPAEARPIILGSIFLRAEDRLLLDLRSCERAIQAIQFFDRYIPRSIAWLTEAEVVNSLFPAENRSLTPASHFDHQPSTFVEPNDVLERARHLTAGISDPLKRLEVVMKDLDSMAKRSLPEIERIPVHYYEDGIAGFAMALRTRQLVALQHWLGNTQFTMVDAIQSINRST